MSTSPRALVLFGFGFVLIMTFNCFTGIVMYALYHDCDPLSVGHVSKLDKMVPYFVEDIMGHLSGMPGVFISCVFSAALSTLSASINSLSGIVYFDYIKPHIHHTEHRANLIMKLFVFFSGIHCIFGGIAVEKFSSILQIVYSIGGVSFGSVTGVFLLGMLVPRAHGRVSTLIASRFQHLIIISTLRTGCSLWRHHEHCLHDLHCSWKLGTQSLRHPRDQHGELSWSECNHDSPVASANE